VLSLNAFKTKTVDHISLYGDRKSTRNFVPFLILCEYFLSVYFIYKILFSNPVLSLSLLGYSFYGYRLALILVGAVNIISLKLNFRSSGAKIIRLGIHLNKPYLKIPNEALPPVLTHNTFARSKPNITGRFLYANIVDDRGRRRTL